MKEDICQIKMQKEIFEANDEMLGTLSEELGNLRKELDQKDAYIEMLKTLAKTGVKCV